MKKKEYWEFWIDERERSIRMSYIVLVLMGVILILAYSLYKIYTTPKPIYVISANQETGIVFPNKYSKTILRDFVKDYLTLTYTYTPNTVKNNLQEASFYITPKLYATTKYDFNNIINYSIQQNVSSAIYFNDKSFTLRQTGDKVWVASIKAVVKQYFGTNTITKNVIFNIVIKKGNPTNKNPFGLYIYSLEVKEV